MYFKKFFSVMTTRGNAVVVPAIGSKLLRELHIDKEN